MLEANIMYPVQPIGSTSTLLSIQSSTGLFVFFHPKIEKSYKSHLFVSTNSTIYKYSKKNKNKIDKKIQFAYYIFNYIPKVVS